MHRVQHQSTVDCTTGHVLVDEPRGSITHLRFLLEHNGAHAGMASLFRRL